MPRHPTGLSCTPGVNRKWRGLLRTILLAQTILLSLHVQAEPQATSSTAITPHIAIVIDDLGNRWPEGRDVISLPGAVTLGIIPFTPYAVRLGLSLIHI